MTQQQATIGDRQRSPDPEPDLLAELQARLERNRAEADHRQEQQAARDAQRTGIEDDLDALQQRIDTLVSENPEEFVIRFIQTEGQ